MTGISIEEWGAVTMYGAVISKDMAVVLDRMQHEEDSTARKLIDLLERVMPIVTASDDFDKEDMGTLWNGIRDLETLIMKEDTL